MMKRRFKRVMSYFFNFDSKTPNKKSKKAKTGTSGEHSSRENAHRESSHVLSESEYIIRKLNEASGVTPRENVSFSRYTPLPRIGETSQEYQVTELSRREDMATAGTDSTSHIITYKFSPVQVRKPPAKVSYQLSPLPSRVAKQRTEAQVETQPPAPQSRLQGETHPPTSRQKLQVETHSLAPRPRLQRQGTYVVKEPVIIKGSLLEYLKAHDNMCSTRVNPPSNQRSNASSNQSVRSTSKRNNSKVTKHVAKVTNSKQRLNEVKAKFKRQQEELKASSQAEQAFWFEL